MSKEKLYNICLCTHAHVGRRLLTSLRMTDFFGRSQFFARIRTKQISSINYTIRKKNCRQDLNPSSIPWVVVVWKVQPMRPCSREGGLDDRFAPCWRKTPSFRSLHTLHVYVSFLCVREYVDVCIHMSTNKNRKLKKMMRILVLSKCESMDPTHWSRTRIIKLEKLARPFHLRYPRSAI